MPRRIIPSLHIGGLLRVLITGMVSALAVVEAHAAESTKQRVVVIGLDGLRPDYVTPELMPHLYALGQRGVVFTKHHSVFPTVTRVNVTSLVTGAYPQTHGILENSIYLPETGSDKIIDTSSRDALMEAETTLGGKLITAESLGEALARQGKKLAVFSNGSSGSAWLMNHRVNNGAIVHREYTQPESLAPRVAELVGAPPEEEMPYKGLHGWVVDAFLKVGLDELRADCCILWLCDPDKTAHAMGVGTPETLDALSSVDAQVQRVLDGLAERRLMETTNVLVVSDHGFSTYQSPEGGRTPLSDFMKSHGLTGRQVKRVSTALYLQDEAAPLVDELAGLLAAWPGGGAMFSPAANPGDALGTIPGTLSFNLARWAHPRAGSLLTPTDWRDAINAFGFAGATLSGGVAGHGNSSPYDIHNTLIGDGPALKSGLANPLPSGNVDVAPTICRLLGVDAPATVEGRVLEEALLSGPDPADIEVKVLTHAAERALPDGGAYRVELQESVIPGARYLDFTKVTRSGT